MVVATEAESPIHMPDKNIQMAHESSSIQPGEARSTPPSSGIQALRCCLSVLWHTQKRKFGVNKSLVRPPEKELVVGDRFKLTSSSPTAR